MHTELCLSFKRSPLPDGLLAIEARQHRLGVTAQHGVVAAASSHPHVPTATPEPVGGSQEEGRRMWDPVLAWIRGREGEISTPKPPSVSSDKCPAQPPFPPSAERELAAEGKN